MKVVAINGSPKKDGNTFHGIDLAAKELENKGIEVKVIHVGNKVIRGCMACGACSKNKNEKCVFNDDIVNDSIQEMKEADGIILASPVHYSAVGGTMKSFLDRVFFVSGANGGMFRHKAGAALVAVRRSGGLPAFNQLNNYLHYSEMVIPNSNYWNVIHGRAPGEALKDNEGVQIMRILGRNMAWLIKTLEKSKKDNPAPEQEAKIITNFVR